MSVVERERERARERRSQRSERERRVWLGKDKNVF